MNWEFAKWIISWKFRLYKAWRALIEYLTEGELDLKGGSLYHSGVGFDAIIFGSIYVFSGILAD